jgi:hypothetical protein
MYHTAAARATRKPRPAQRRNYRDTDGPRPLPAPTLCLPGTNAKAAVFVARHRLHQQLWHPRDAVVTEAGGDGITAVIDADGTERILAALQTRAGLKVG